MADSYIGLPADGAGKKTQTFTNTVNAETVHATGTSIVKSSSGAALESPSGNSVAVGGNINSGSADSGSPVKTGAVYNATEPSPTTGQRVDMQADDKGSLRVASRRADSRKLTYSSAITELAVVTGATSIYEVLGSASGTTRITGLSFSASAASAALISVQIAKRSTALTGGTSTTPAKVPHNSGDAAAGASVKAYTANPGGGGTLVGVIRSFRYLANTSAAMPGLLTIDFEKSTGKAVELLSAAETLTITLNGETLSSCVANISVEWTETA